MKEMKDCKSYDGCKWRKSVGSCPDGCDHFRNKDEMVVTRCRDCKHFRENSLSKYSGNCAHFDGHKVNPNGYCNNAERKNENE